MFPKRQHIRSYGTLTIPIPYRPDESGWSNRLLSSAMYNCLVVSRRVSLIADLGPGTQPRTLQLYLVSHARTHSIRRRDASSAVILGLNDAGPR